MGVGARGSTNGHERHMAIILLVSLVILLGLGAWLVWDGGTAASQPVQRVATHNEALVLQREAGRLWASGERTAALEQWEAAHQLRPESLAITESLARAHVAVASDLLRAAEPEKALPHLEAAYALLPSEPAVLHEYQALRAYLAGRDAVGAQAWHTALEALGPLHSLDPAYLDVQVLMERALAGNQQTLVEQSADREQALSHVRMSQPGLRARELFAPAALSNLPGQTTTPPLGWVGGESNKHIVVSINAQRMYVYEKGQLIWDWVASTGEPGRPTIPGRYRIQSQIENARSNVWSLWMPYWQGIYWAGSVENGIHGQVTFDSGGRLWEGYLGTRVTYGCVMIADDNAETLFNWAEMGTPVSIHWEWNPAWTPDANGDPIAASG